MPQKKSSSCITLSRIAKEVGLSSAAVSMALRGHKRVSAETRQRVAEAAARLGYVYNRGAARLRTGQSHTVGIVIGDISNAFFGELVAGVDEIIDAAGKTSFLFNTRENQQRQQHLLTRLREQGVDGMIICPAPGTDESLFDEISRWGIPCVQMLRHVSGHHGDYVGADYRTGMDALCEHLIQLGHRRIAFIGGNLEHSATSQRIEGFHAALARHNLKPFSINRCELTRRAGKDVIKTLMKKSPPPSAAVCYSDIIAFGVIAGLRELGLNVGQDFSVTGFDNVDEAQESWPPLTTAASHARDIGMAAGRLLLRRIAEPDAPPERNVLPTDIIIRKTCGPPPGPNSQY